MSQANYRALLIANSTFPNDPHNLPDLEGPRNDPALVRHALCDDRYGLFASDKVRLVTERTMAEVLREAATFLGNAHRSDILLLYYSGHGRLTLSNELYFCTRDSQVDLMRATAVKASDLRAMIDDSAAATTIVVLDCCHSGVFKGGSIAEKLVGRGRFILTSCRPGELANDSSARNHASMFTHHLVQGLLGRATDQDGDGFVDLDDLYHYVYDHLTDEGRQIPERSFAGSGDVPVARRPDAAADLTRATRSSEQKKRYYAVPNTTTADTGAKNPTAESVLDISPRKADRNEVKAGSHMFLSNEWTAAARRLREEFGDEDAVAPEPVRMNFTVTEVPFGDGTIECHLDTTSGVAAMELGHLDRPDVSVTLDYDTAKHIMVDGDPQVGMQAFMAGKITLRGDMTKALAMQSGPPNPEMVKRIKEITK